MPVCSNCGGSDFVWAENLRTGGLGRGGLSLRSGGELAIGTRVCRGCGHADLFVKDPTVLRQPHTWKPGEFVPIPPRTPAPQRPGAAATEPPAPTAPGPSVSSAPSPASVTMPAPRPAAVASPVAAPPPPSAPIETAPTPTPDAPQAPEPIPEPVPAVGTEREPERKRPARRKGARGKTVQPSVIHE